MRGIGFPASLLAVQLDDELFGHGDLDVLAQRQTADDAPLLVDIDLEPLGDLATAGVGVVVHPGAQLGRRSQLDDVAHLGEERGHAGLAAVDLEVAVGHHLPGLAARGGEAEAVHDVVQPQLQQPQEVLAGDALLALGPLEVLPELALQHPVDALGLLLLAQLHAERRQLAAVQPVLAGRVVPPLDRAPVGEAASALEEELHPLPAAQPALGIAIPRHPRPPPTPAAASAAGSRRRRGRGGGRLLLHHDALAGALARPRVGVRALPAHRQPLAVTDPAVGADVHQALDVHRDLPAVVALHLELALDELADARRLVLGPGLHALGRIDVGLGHDAAGRGPPDPVDVRHRHFTALLSRKIDPRHSRHAPSPLALPLLVPRVLAYDPHHALALDDLAVLAARLDRRSHLHHSSPRSSFRAPALPAQSS